MIMPRTLSTVTPSTASSPMSSIPVDRGEPPVALRAGGFAVGCGGRRCGAAQPSTLSWPAATRTGMDCNGAGGGPLQHLTGPGVVDAAVARAEELDV